LTLFFTEHALRGMPVDSLHSEYEPFLLKSLRARDVIAGEDAMQPPREMTEFICHAEERGRTKKPAECPRSEPVGIRMREPTGFDFVLNIRKE
jgi:hypothetical protein